MATKDPLTTDPPCQSRACAIQDCLAKNSYDETKCRSQVDALYECCNSFYDKYGDNAQSASCPKPNLL
ncbi:hypothetical protein OIDMADRAFT_18795, partial [Oidiodendron maius Zn]